MTESPWFPFFYQYIIGGLVFISSIILAIRKKAMIITLKKDKKLLRQLVFGFILYLAFHGIMIILAGV